MAAKPKGLDSIRAAARAIASRLPFRTRIKASPEPFSAIEDETPLGDLLSSENAAPITGAKKADENALDLKALAISAGQAAVKSTPILVALVAAAGFLAAVVITAVVVAAPPRKAPAEPPFTAAGEALVRTWLPPRGDPLEPRMPMQREDSPSYSAADAAKLGMPGDPKLAAGLRVKNDEAIEDLYGTVP